MKAIGYAGAKLFRCRYGAYSTVICAPDHKTAQEAFVLFLNDRGHRDTIYSAKLRITSTKHVGESPLYWAQVDVTTT